MGGGRGGREGRGARRGRWGTRGGGGGGEGAAFHLLPSPSHDIGLLVLGRGEKLVALLARKPCPTGGEKRDGVPGEKEVVAMRSSPLM